jgi:hypothetical protein
MKRRTPLSIRTHVILGRLLSAASLLTLAALRETRDHRQREALLQFRDDLDRFRSAMDDTIFRDYRPAESGSDVLGRIYFGTAQPLLPDEIVSLATRTKGARLGMSTEFGPAQCELNLSAGETMNRITRDLLSVSRLITALSFEDPGHSTKRRRQHD